MTLLAYSQESVDYLKAKDPRMAEVISAVGSIEREADPDLFQSVIHHIIGQQISSVAQATVWKRLCKRLDGTVDARSVVAIGVEGVQAVGTTYRKAEYICDFANKVLSGAFDLDAVARMPDKDAIDALSSLKGIGVWTAEMILLFCLGRPDILSYGDLAIQRGLRMVYHHRTITPQLFERYRRRFSPFGSTVSLYLWAVAGGAVEGMRDYAPKRKR